MWLSLIVLGALHGLVLLPVLLSLAGGPGYSVDDEDEEWMSSAIRRHDYEYTYVVSPASGIGDFPSREFWLTICCSGMDLGPSSLIAVLSTVTCSHIPPSNRYDVGKHGFFFCLAEA
ncbi:hypothetical protein DL93DRAFT_355171 [Clavulina sp. PMI_390]|nr:hypothetical protein DL93DRAFT_355171 [Clavulina sp. PMI_390]